LFFLIREEGVGEMGEWTYKASHDTLTSVHMYKQGVRDLTNQRLGARRPGSKRKQYPGNVTRLQGGSRRAHNIISSRTGSIVI
jgi:hypothetical protein